MFDETTEDSQLWLHQAVKYSDMDTLIELLTSSSPKSNPQNDQDNQEQDSESIQKCPDVNVKDSQHRTATDLAALTGQLDFVQALKQQGGRFGLYAGKMYSIAKKRSRQVEAYRKHIQASLE